MMKFLIEEIDHSFDYGQGTCEMTERNFAIYDPITDRFYTQQDDLNPVEITMKKFNEMIRESERCQIIST